MDNINRETLLKEFAFYANLLEKHEAAKKQKNESSSDYQSSQKLNIKHPSLPNYKLTKNSTPPLTSFNHKYSFQKSKSFSIAHQNKRTVFYNQNQYFKPKHVLSKNQTLKTVSLADKDDFKINGLNRNILPVCKQKVKSSGNGSGEASTISSDDFDKTSRAQLIEEIQLLTQQLKKKTSENKLLNSSAKNKNVIQNEIPSCKDNSRKYYYSAFNKYNSVNYENTFSRTKSQRESSSVVNLNSPQKSFNPNKYCYKKDDAGQMKNFKVITAPLNTVGNKDQPKNKFEKSILVPHSRKVIYSDVKTAPKTKCLSINDKILLKPTSPDKPSVAIKLNVTKGTISSDVKKSKESSNVLKVKSPILLKSSKVSKLKPASTRYTKINKYLTTQSKNKLPKNVSVHREKLTSTRKCKRNVNTKYKVINKTTTSWLNKKTNSLSSSLCKDNSFLAVDESDPFLKELNNSEIDKLEQDLLAISTALTSTPLSCNSDASTDKKSQYSYAKSNSKLCIKKISLKKSRARISKYKIVNSNNAENYSLKRKQKFANMRTCLKRVNYSKFSVVNKPVHTLPVWQERSVLVKRLFKSKNTIINKNASSTNYSAKMIKSKYLTLNKRKSPSWKKNVLYPKVPSQLKKFKGYSQGKLHCPYSRYQKTAIMTYPKAARKFSSCRWFIKNASMNKYKMKLKSGYAHSPVVFIHGMRYSLNSSGKTLKKLPAKGQTNKTLRRMVIGAKGVVRTSETAMKTSPTNLANRVLHRSINRILAASSKKSLTKVNTYCMFYNRFGRCNRGVKCTYIHDPSKIAVCTRFLRGTCKVDGCPFSHEISPGKMAVCSFFLVGNCEKENCPYRHEKLLPDAVLCKAFVQGYCPNGKECKKAHILICPKYIQGECEKGTSCAFPHPPKKVKKNVQKELEDAEKKPEEVLFEKVARYFQQIEESALSCENKSDEINIANLFVPKQRRLEEQPSFIPLFDSPAVSHS